MRCCNLILAGLLSTVVVAQSVNLSSQPACIQQCDLFSKAQQACSPDQAVAAQYTSCFCQSAYLQPIKSNPSGNICPNCASGDWTTIASWYNGLCGGTGAAAGAGTGQTTLTTVTNPAAGATTTTGTGTGTTTGAAATTTDSSTPQLSSEENPANWTDSSSWFRTHWQWVVMIIVLAVAFTAIGIIGTIIHKKKSRARTYGTNYTAPMTSNPAVNTWAPNRQSVHEFGTPREASPAPAMPQAAAGTGSRRQSRRLGKAPSVR